MNVLCISIIVHSDIVVRICRVHFGKEIFSLNEQIISIFQRCIRERNCGTGYQVDPVTQTCVGENSEGDDITKHII